MRNQGYEIIKREMITVNRGCVIAARENAPERFVCWYLNFEDNEPVYRQGFYADSLDEVQTVFLERVNKMKVAYPSAFNKTKEIQ